MKANKAYIFREHKIFLFYQYYLIELTPTQLQERLIKDKYFLFSILEIKQIEKIIKHLKEIENEINYQSVNWDWNQIGFMEKALLINAYYEMFFLKVSKKIIISEYVKLSKIYASKDQSYKLVNGILDSLPFVTG